MSVIIHGGHRYTKFKNAIYCKKCTDTIESKYGNDFKHCSCGSIGIDGGLSDDPRYMGDPADMETRCTYKATIHGKTSWLPEAAVQQQFSQPVGHYKMGGMYFKYTDPPPATVASTSS